MRARPAAVLVALCCLSCEALSAQSTLSGHISLLADFLPNRDDTAELRARVFAEEKLEPSASLRVIVSGFVEGLLAKRSVPPPGLPEVGSQRDVRSAAAARVQDANVEWRSDRLDLLAGFSRVPWGKLDELQPTDVINPLDVSRFFFEGRTEARLAVALVRARLFARDDAVFEGVYVPAFRRGRFDQLEEDTSPFNLAVSARRESGFAPAVIEDRPGFGNAQGGVRFTATSGRVDWSVSAYRGFEPFGLVRIVAPATVERIHPRFTMLGADFETVRGEWGVRGETAFFVEDSFQSPALAIVAGSSIDAGLGVDRRAGDFRVSGTVLFHRERYDAPLGAATERGTSREDVSLVASLDRNFARERYHLRLFGVYNASESAGFARAITTVSLRDNFALEGSLGWFGGDGTDIVGRFGDSDFLYARLKYYF